MPKKPNNYCKDCDKDTFVHNRDYYMVQHELWKKFGAGKNMLCWECLEKRMGRSIVAEDILPCPLTVILNPHTSELLKTIGIT